MSDGQAGVELSTRTTHQVGYYAALLTTIITVITFGFAMIAIPISGANCPPGECVEYPYLDTVSQFPRDFLWMPLAMLLVLIYLILIVAIQAYAENHKKIFGQIGLVFAVISAVILLGAYFTQFSVVPVSLMNGETDGLPLLIQYNAHGLFIALEELGYLMMSLSFLFAAPVFAGRGRRESAVRWVFIAGFGLTIAALVAISIMFGLERLDRFEVFAITIDWLVLIINGVLLSMVFRRHLKEQRTAPQE